MQQANTPDSTTTVPTAAAAAAAGELLLVMFDPCCEPLTPGWPLRNALLLAAVRWGLRRLKVLCVRDGSAGRAKAERCFVLEVSTVRRACSLSMVSVEANILPRGSIPD
jgi:hypothetical protein